ncbi:MAG: LysM peptidoglycan-binding domain-containing protein [Paraglaciecola sp.]
MESKSKLAAVIGCLVLMGCGAVGEKSAQSDSVNTNNKSKTTQELINYTAEAGLTAKQRFTKALEKLENGEEGQALAELNAYLEAVPRSNSAKNLVEQITTESTQYFPADFFTVDLTSGVSLSTLAKRYLGSALKFYALAKYNDISNPSRVDIGQQIKIPLTQLAKTIRKKEQSITAEVVAPEAPLAETPEADVVADTPDVAETVKEAEVEIAAPKAPEITASSLIDELESLNSKGSFSAATEKVEALKSFGEFDKKTRNLALTAYIGRAKELTDTDNKSAANYYADAGQLNLINGESLAAFKNFKLATNLDQDNLQAMEDMLILQKDIADKFHREASSAFRRQELDIAIAKWDQVLEVNPDHSSASLYRAQAIELKARLDKIKKN